MMWDNSIFFRRDPCVKLFSQNEEYIVVLMDARHFDMVEEIIVLRFVEKVYHLLQQSAFA